MSLLRCLSYWQSNLSYFCKEKNGSKFIIDPFFAYILLVATSTAAHVLAAILIAYTTLPATGPGF